MSKYDDLVCKLKEIFQIDKPELDFGVYRILNARSAEITDYLENRLKAKVLESLSSAGNAESEQVKKDLAETEKNAASLGLVPENVPKVQELRQKLASYGAGNNEHENSVFTHLLTFFSRYYDSGDFISQRRYKGDTYAIPYAGEEVMLHWANKDQYYTKSGENFSNYAFKLDDGRVVRFKLVTADTAKDNRKDNDKERRFALIEAQTRNLLDDEGDEYEDTLLPITEETNLEGTQELVIRFEYKAYPKGTKQETLSDQAIKTILEHESVKARWLDLSKREPTEKNPSRTLLEKCLTNYTSKNTADYFIHKDLGGFLKREIDFYIKNEVMHLDDVQHAQAFADIEKNLRMIQTLRSIAQDIITFLAQLEDFQKKLWLKKKFVVSTHYCITLDRIDEALYPQIAANPKQWEQWQQLGMLEGSIPSGDAAIAHLKAYPFLMVDTTLFDAEFKFALLKQVDAIDEKLDGLLMHGDNFQGLNLLKNRYFERVKCIYIDPPYNTGADEFLYKDKYQHSSWLSMVSDRITLALPLMQASGTFAVSIDLKESDKLTSVLDSLLGEDCKKNSITIKRGSATGAKVINPGVVNTTESVLLYAVNSKRWEPNRAYRRKEYDTRYGNFIINFEDSYETWKFSSVLDAFSEKINIKKSKLKSILGQNYQIELEKFVVENAERVIQFVSLDDGSISEDARQVKAVSIQTPNKIFYLPRKNANDYYIVNGSLILFYKHRLIKVGGEWVPGEPITDIWDDVLPNDLHNEGGVTLRKGKKPEKLVNRVLEIGSNEKELILDFFVGSGTSAAVAHKTKRKWIGIEQGEYFESTTKARLLKTINGESSGISNVTVWKGGGFFKTIKIESYEDTLNNLQLNRSQAQQDLLTQLPEAAQDDYLMRYMLDVESKESLLSVKHFNKPFDYKLKVAVDSAGAFEEKPVDLVETFNYLIGLHVEQMDYQLAQGFATINGRLPSGEKTLVLWRDTEQVDYEALNKLCDKLAINPADSEYDVVFINGDHNIPTSFTSLESEGGIKKEIKIRSIEEAFLTAMFEVEDV